MSGEKRLTLTETDQSELFGKMLERAKAQGGDPVAEAELAGKILDRRYYGKERVVGSLLELADAGDALAKLKKKKKKGTREDRVAELRRAYERGERSRAAHDLDLDGLARVSQVNEAVETLRIRKEAAELFAQEGNGDDGTFAPADFDEWLEAGDVEPPSPSLGSQREDSVFLLYPGAFNGVFGESGHGKTQFASVNAADILKTGGAVDWIDTDANGKTATFARLRAMGVSDDALRERFRFWEPATSGQFTIAVAAIVEALPDLVVLDSIGASMGLFGLDQLSDRDYTAFHAQHVTPIIAAGGTILALDHTMKTKPDALYAGGSSAKRRVVDGAYYTLERFKAEPFKRGAVGKAAIRLAKDRHGGTGYGEGETVAVFVLDTRDPDGGPADWRFHPAKPADERAVDEIAGDVAIVEALPTFPSSTRELKAALQVAGIAMSATRQSEALRIARERKTVTFELPAEPSTPKKKGKSKK